MKAVFLTALSVFALFAFSAANDLPKGEMKRNDVKADMSLPLTDRLTAGVPPKIVDLTVKFVLFNLKMRPRFEDGTIVLPRYKKRVQSFARRAQRLALKDLEESDGDEDSGDDKVSARSISTRNLGPDALKLPVASRDACNNCNAACAGAAFTCRRGCIFAGPEAVVQCEIAWAGVAAGCFGVCALRFC